jgi:hypothetical protein
MAKCISRLTAIAALVVSAGGSLFECAPAQAAVFSVGNGFGAPFGGSVCADVAGGNLSTPTKVQAWQCLAGPNQQFEFYGSTIFALGGQRCLDVWLGGTTPGTTVDSYSCNGTGAQQWYYYRGQIVNLQSGLCLDATNMLNGTQLIINSCSSSSSQQWQIK